MRFNETPLAGAYVVDLEPINDERGWFARTFAREEFEAHGVAFEVVHANASFNARAGTLRGLHYQTDPHAEAKLVRCTRGAVFDVVIDLRPASPTFKGWFGIELSDANGRMLFAPEGVAHGFQTLVAETELAYLMSHHYVSEASRGVRWDDPAFGIEWPDAAERLISERDRSYPDFTG